MRARWTQASWACAWFHSILVVEKAERRRFVIDFEYRYECTNSNSNVYVSAPWLQKRVLLFENIRVVYRFVRAVKCERIHWPTSSNSKVYTFIVYKVYSVRFSLEKRVSCNIHSYSCYRSTKWFKDSKHCRLVALTRKRATSCKQALAITTMWAATCANLEGRFNAMVTLCLF